MKKILAAILFSTLCVLTINCIAFAADGNAQIISPYWVNTSQINGSVSINGTTGNFSAFIIGNTNVTNITAKATLYYKNSSNKWIEIPTDWEYSSNSNNLFVNETFNASSGTTYKVVFEADVYANGYTETITKEFT